MKKYEVVKTDIVEDIKAGKYVPNQKIISESKLTEKLGVSRHTVRRAINDLVNEGWLYTEQGAGTFCAAFSNHKPEVETSAVTKKTIALVTTYISNYIFPQIIEGVESYLSENGYDLLLFSTKNDLEKERQCLENVFERNIAGVIVEPTKSNFYNPNFKYYLKFEQNNIPYIMLNATYPELTPHSITIDDEGGTKALTNHLIQLGHTNIVGIFKTDDRQGAGRMQGYIRAHRENNILINPNTLLTTTKEEWASILTKDIKALFSQQQYPTAIVCYNDELALEVLEELRKLHINVPEDVSIVGFDNSYLATATEVKLTTIEHPQFAMGQLAAEKIVELIENGQPNTPINMVYEPKIIIRSSTKENVSI